MFGSASVPTVEYTGDGSLADSGIPPAILRQLHSPTHLFTHACRRSSSTATNLTSLDELYAEPALADTLYGHVVMGAMSSDEFADGDRLPALMVKTHLLT